MSDQLLGAVPLSGNDRPSRAYGKGRICEDQDCSTRLSIYNDGRYCYRHEPMLMPRTRGRKSA